MKINTFILIALFLTAVAPVAFAADISSLADVWGAPTMNYCISDNNATIADACIGTDKGTCAAWQSGNDTNTPYKTGVPYGGHGMGAVILLVARTVNENGAYFCPTQLNGWTNNNSGNDFRGGGTNAQTVYFNPMTGGTIQNDTSGCFWLCKPGFAGNGCTAADTGAICSPTDISRTSFDKYQFTTATSASNQESSIARFYANKNNACGDSGNQEHDMILGVSEFLDSGHGAWVQPMMFRAWRKGWKGSYTVSPGVSVVGSPTLLCMDGYTSNGMDCVVNPDSACAIHSILTKSEMTNGVGRDCGTCWQLDNVDEYKNCVLTPTDDTACEK